MFSAICFERIASDMRVLQENQLPDRISVRTPFSIGFDSFTAEQYDSLIGFTKEEAIRLFNVMHIPQQFVLNEGD